MEGSRSGFGGCEWRTVGLWGLWCWLSGLCVVCVSLGCVMRGGFVCMCTLLCIQTPIEILTADWLYPFVH